VLQIRDVFIPDPDPKKISIPDPAPNILTRILDPGSYIEGRKIKINLFPCSIWFQEQDLIPGEKLSRNPDSGGNKVADPGCRIRIQNTVY
jgi:hypothetical protein